MNIFEKLFAFIKKLFKKIIDIIKKILPYILLACAIWLALGGAISIPFLDMVIEASTANALLVAGASFIFVPQETAELVSRATAGIGQAAKDVIHTVVDVAGSAAADVLSQPVVLIGLFALAWFLLARRKDDKQEPVTYFDQPKQELLDA